MTATDYKYWSLRNHQFFSTLSDEKVLDLCIISKYKVGAKSEVIYFSEERTNRIYLLKKGMIKIVELNEKGDEVIKDIIQQGDLFGELSLTNGNGNKETAIAMSDEVSICSFRITDFQSLLEKNPRLTLEFAKRVGDKLVKLENRYTNLVFKDVKHRLLIFIKEWAEREGEKKNDTFIIRNYLTHQDIADLVCSTRQTVTQLMNELADEGKLLYSRKEIVVFK